MNFKEFNAHINELSSNYYSQFPDIPNVNFIIFLDLNKTVPHIFLTVKKKCNVLLIKFVIKKTTIIPNK